MQAYVRNKLQEAIQAQDGECTAEDLLRTFAEQAALMFQTEQVKSMLRSDPYEHLQDIKRSVESLCQVLQVTEYEKVQTPQGYCRIAATITIPPDVEMQKIGAVSKYVQLYFLYEREGTRHDGEPTSVWYAIDVARDDGPREKILWVKVFAAGSVPSALPAQNLDDDDEDGWEDIDEDDDDQSTSQAESKLKKARLSEDEEPTEDQDMKEAKTETIMMDEDDPNGAPLADRFTAGIDPVALSQFWQWTRLQETDEATSFFLLMTFPFYEMEFDLTGFILDAVFGAEDEDEQGADDDKQDEDDN